MHMISHTTFVDKEKKLKYWYQVQKQILKNLTKNFKSWFLKINLLLIIFT